MSRAGSPLQIARQYAEVGRFDQAAAVLVRHLQQSPKDLHATLALGELCLRQGQFDRAEFYFARALGLNPADAQIRSDHGQALLALGRLDEAITSFREVLNADPSIWMAAAGLAQAHLNKLEFREAAIAAEQGIRNRPDIAENYDHLARALMLCGRLGEAIDIARRGISLAPGHQGLRATLAVCLTYSDGASAEVVANAYRVSGLALAAGRPFPKIHWPNSPDPDRVLKIGYLSPDFRLHSVAYFMEPILAHHDAAAVQVFAYSTTRQPDAVTQRIRSMVTARGGRWIDAAALSTDAIAQRIRTDNLDMLIELAGYSHGGLLGVTLLRPAPVQVSYLGWAATTGMPTVDWRIVDSITDPSGYESHSTESLARLDPCFVCYAGEPEAPEPELPDGPPVFGSFNAAYKITPTCIRAWAAAMTITPESRLIVKASQLEHEDYRHRILAQFGQHGVDPARIELLGRTLNLADHFAAYRRIHVALDTFPYNGTTTTCEALWMGVPVVTLEGVMHAGRVGKSLLSALGAPEWVARDEADFARIATGLVNNTASLSILRGTLRDRIKASPLCDGAAFTRRLESTYRSLWREWCVKAKA